MSNAKKPMNLLYIFSDQHSREVCGCYGNPYVHTPNIDKLAENGTMFRNAYSSNPICVPARASMVTGDYSFRNNFWDNAHPYCGQAEGWGHRLEEQGIKNVTIGKLHYQDDVPETGFSDQRIPLNVRGGTGDLTHLIRDSEMRRPVLHGEVVNAGQGDSEYLRYDAKVAEQTVEFLKTEGVANPDQPWSLFVGFVCPHFPWKVPQELMDLYTPYDKLPFPVEWSLDERPMHPALEYMRRELCFYDISDDEVRKAVATYYAMTTYLDQQIGKVLDTLKELGLDKTTRIIYTDDHGDSVGRHGLFFKHNMYEGSVGVPMIMSGPDIPKGKVVEENVSLVDIFPTVLDCMGVEPKEQDKNLPGISLYDMANGQRLDEAQARAVFSEYHNVGTERAIFMVKKDSYKLVYYVGNDSQLFDLATDPDEVHDLAKDPAYATVLKAMEGELRKICDPEEIDLRARTQQKTKLEALGGRDAIMGIGTMSYSPVPSGVV